VTAGGPIVDRPESTTGPARETRAQRVVARPCGFCGERFEPVRPHQTFCRPSCRWHSFKARRQRPLLDVIDGDQLAAYPFE
jgi:hypothetical protein